MDRPMPRGLPRTPISGLPRKTPSHLERVEIHDPKTGRTQTHSRQNAMDLVRLNGWVFTKTVQAQKDVTLADGRRVTGEHHDVDADSEAGEEARAEDKQDGTADDAEVGTQVAFDGEGASGVQSGASESDSEAVSKLDELRAEAETLGIKIDKRWGLGRLQKEIDAERF